MPSLTHQEFLDRLSKINNNIIINDTYKNMHTKVSCKCKICGHEWSATPQDLLRGAGCVECYKKSRGIGRTTEEFKEILKEISPTIIIRGKYVDSETKITCECSICGNVWDASPGNLLKGRGCKKCSDMKQRKTHEQFMSEMNEANSDIQILSKYSGARNKVLCKCTECGELFNATPTHLLSGKGCPYCAPSKIAKALSTNPDDYAKKLYSVFPYLDLISDFKNYKTKVTVQCNKCGHTWEALPGSLLVGCGCPNCSVRTLSSGEKLIKEYLDINNIAYDMHRTFDSLRNDEGFKLSYDFYIPSKNILIEFQGTQHYRPVEIFGGTAQFQKQIRHDEIKRKFAKDNNITLLEIKYKDKNKITQILDTALLNNIIPVETESA